MRPFAALCDRASECLRPAFDVHEDGLSHAGQLRITVGCAQRDHLVRTGDERGKLLLAPLRTCPSERSTKPL